MKAMMSERGERYMWYWQISEDDDRAARDEREAEHEARRILAATEPRIIGRFSDFDGAPTTYRATYHRDLGTAGDQAFQQALADSLAAFVAMTEAEAFGEVANG